MIYLMRHGNDYKEFIGGWSNISLTDKGKKKVKENALWIKNNLKIEKIISSDIKRAQETSEIVKDVLKIDYELSNLLREQNKGDLNGKPKSELTTEEKELIENQKIDTEFINGERLIDLYERIKKNLNFFKTLEDNTLIITHRGVINMFYYLLRNIDLDMDKEKFDVDFASIHELDFENNTIKRIK